MAEQALDVSRVTPQPGSLRSLLESTAVKTRFEAVLGRRAPQFIASLSTLVYGSDQLKRCDPNTIIAAALQAAAFDLPIDPSLAQAHLIPYGSQARFQPGWRAFVQLALRSQQYTKLNVTEVYQGEIRGEHRLTGDLIWGERTGDQVAGYAAYFRLVSGFEKALYMTVDELQAHGARYSKTYARADSKWKTDFDAMARKTVLKQLLSKWGPLSIELQAVIAADVPPEEPAAAAPTNGHGPAQSETRARLWGDEEEPASGEPAPVGATPPPAPGPGAAMAGTGEVDWTDPAQVAASIERDQAAHQAPLVDAGDVEQQAQAHTRARRR